MKERKKQIVFIGVILLSGIYRRIQSFSRKKLTYGTVLDLIICANFMEGL